MMLFQLQYSKSLAGNDGVGGQFKVLIRHLFRDTEENHEKPQPQLLINQPRLEPGNSRIYVCRITATITCLVYNFRAIKIIKECDKTISVVITL
jgi:hypothetical protein